MSSTPPRRGRTILGVAAGAVLVVAAAGLAFALFNGDDPASRAGGGAPEATPAAPPTTVQREFTKESAEGALRDIVALRTAALRTLDAAILERIYTPSCECLKRDRKIIADLRKDGLRLNRSTFTLLRVRTTSFEEVGRTAVIEYTAESRGSDYVNEDGEVVERDPGSGTGRFEAHLVWDGTSWAQALAVRVG